MPQSQTVIQPLRWPLVNKLQARGPSTPLTKDARLVNCFAEYDEQDNAYWIYKRPGLSTAPYATISGLGGGMYTYAASGATPTIFSVWNTNSGNANLYAGTSLLSTVNQGVYTWETINSNPQTVVLHDTANGYIINVSTLAVTHIVDVNFPSIMAPGWAYLDGTLYVMDLLGNIWGTAGMNNAATWSALNVIQASSNADSGVALAKQLSYVVALKQWTTQIFYDAGNPTGSPLSVVPDAQIPLGCLNGDSVQQIDNTLLWLTSNQTASPQIVQMDNLTPKVVSTPAVERVLDNVNYSLTFQLGFIFDNSLKSWVLKHGGHRLYGLSSKLNNFTLVYDLDQQLWYIWTDTAGNYWPITALAYLPPAGAGGNSGTHYAQNFNGNIYQLDGDYAYPNDSGTVFPVDIYTPNFEAGTKRRKHLNMMYFGADQTSGSKLQVRYNDYDFDPTKWSNFRTVDLSETRPRLPNHGTFTRRAYHFRHQCNTTFRLRSVDLQLDMGTL